MQGLRSEARYIPMLIESRIAFTVRDMLPDQISDAVTFTRQAMRSTLERYREPVVLFQVERMTGSRIGLLLQTLRSRSFHTYVYDYAARSQLIDDRPAAG